MSAKPDPIGTTGQRLFRRYPQDEDAAEDWERVKVLATFGRHVLGLLAKEDHRGMGVTHIAFTAEKMLPGCKANVFKGAWVTGAEAWLEPKDQA